MIKIEELMAILPHRYPFILIDRVTSIDPAPKGSWEGRKGTAIKNVTMNEQFFTGHFPGKPIMPWGLQLSAIFAAAIVGYKPGSPGELTESYDSWNR